MAGSPTRTSDQPPRRHGFDDTVPASEPPGGGEAAVDPTPKPERYRLGAELGRGGMGRVVEAFDVQLGRTVALKEILPKAGSGTAKRFAREIEITARLEHASIVPLYDSGVSADGRPFYVMRRVTGKPLDEMIARARGLDERLTLLPAMLSAIDAVAHAHGRGVIHRDLKPANILVGELGETVVIDWGLAKVIGEEDESVANAPSADDSLKTQIGSVFGTPGFMAPEQARGEELGTHGDVYALGACLYQLLAASPPHHGNSATEVMDKTRTHDIRPLDETAPGAPPELVAIVAKALAFDPVDRYPHAGALGEDVRRFLAGQLVAAHDYTSVQKLARFARRHRGVLAVAALATVAVAVMAWIGVHRIMTERDAANVARQEAQAGRAEAEDARDRLVDRHDALVVMQARSLLDSNPTEALAVLKQLSHASRRLDEARAIGQAAVVRGPAYAMQSTMDFTTIAELDETGDHLLQVSRDGMVRVFDLQRRRSVLARPFAMYSRATWVAGGRVLITHDKADPQLLDPRTNTIEPLHLEPITYAVATERGDRVVYATASKKFGLLDVASRKALPLAFDGKPGDTSLAAGADWFAISGDDVIVVYDRDGKELTRRPGGVTLLRASGHRSLVGITAERVVECTLDPQPAWSELPIARKKPAMAIDARYRGTRPVIYFTDGTLMEWTGTTFVQRGQMQRMQLGMHPLDDGTVMVPGLDGKLHWFNETGSGALVLPSNLHRMRIAARRDAPRLAAVGNGIIHVFELAPVLPKRIPVMLGSTAIFVDDATLLLLPARDSNMRWHDLATGKSIELPYKRTGAPTPIDADAQGGRVLLIEHAPGGIRFVELRKNTAHQRTVVEGRAVWARLLPDRGLIFGVGDGRVYAQIGDESPREIVKLDGVAEQAVPLGGLRYAVHGSTGEIVRGDLATGTVERVRVPVGSSGFVSSDGQGHVLIFEDNRLLRWDTAVREIAKFDKPITQSEIVEGGVLVYVGQDREVQFVELSGQRVTPHRLFASSLMTGSSANGKLVAGLSGARALTLVELPSRARWSIPSLANARDAISVSPDARRLLQTTDSAIAIWQLPRAGADLHAWLDEQTNATIDREGLLAWPWQSSAAP